MARLLFSVGLIKGAQSSFPVVGKDATSKKVSGFEEQNPNAATKEPFQLGQRVWGDPQEGGSQGSRRNLA